VHPLANMSTPKPVWWVSALMTRFEEQLPCRVGPQTHLTRINVQQNKESLIHISKFKFSLVISGLTKILTKISEMPSASLPDFERDHYDSQLIVLDTLEKCLSSQAPEAPKYDDVMNVKLLLKEICQFLDLPASMDNSQVAQIRNLASKVLHALSVNNFNAVFSRISGRLQELSVSSGEESHAGNLTDIELVQHIHVDRARLTKLLQEANSKFRTLRKAAHLVLVASLERAIWNWMDAYPQV
jgi:neurofibromin 1